MAEAKPEKTTGLSTRGAVVAGVGVVLIVVVVLWVVMVLVPVLEMNRLLREVRPSQKAVERLGGPERAVRRVSFYIRRPACMAYNREAAVYLLGFCGSGAVPVLGEVLKDEDGRIRRCAALALCRIGPEARDAIPALREVYANEAEPGKVRAAAVLALGRISGDNGTVVSVLKQALREDCKSIREAAAEALGMVGPAAKDAVPALESALGDGEARVRYSAALALVQITGNSQRGLPVLVDALSHKHDKYQVTCMLGRLGPLAKDAVPALARMLNDEKDSRARLFAAEALGNVGPTAGSAIPALERARKDRYRDVREAARDALKKIRGEAGAEEAPAPESGEPP